MWMSLRYYSLGVWCLVFLSSQCWSAPANDDRPQIIEIIAPAQAAQETLDSLNLGEPNYEQSERSKRTIGVLRELFPNLSKLIDQKVQMIASYLITTIGPTIISGLLGQGGLFGGGGKSNDAVGGTISGSFSDSDESDEDKTEDVDNGSKISVVLPTSPPGAIDNDEDDEENEENASVAGKSSVNAKSENLRLRQGDDDDDSVEALPPSDEAKPSTEVSVEPISRALKTSNDKSNDKDDDGPISMKIPLAASSAKSLDSSPSNFVGVPKSAAATATSGGNPEENQLDGAESQQQEVKVIFDEAPEGDSKVRTARKSDQLDVAASDNNEALDDLTLENADDNEENRDKRLVSFGFGNAASSGGSGGGSGNFLFDIVRLVAGSGGTEQTDETNNETAADGELKGDGYTEGIPGPVTRLFIVANRGISNLIQDLILRIAQTSERLVNFKARLITSII